MDLDTAATFLLGSIGYGMGFILWIGVVIVVNNLLSKYWKPVKMFTHDSWFINPPIVDKSVEPQEVADARSQEKRNGRS
jgi:hypothetical protein